MRGILFRTRKKEGRKKEREEEEEEEEGKSESGKFNGSGGGGGEAILFSILFSGLSQRTEQSRGGETHKLR